MTPNTQGASWEEEFEERWGHAIGNLALSRPEIKDFIRTLLSKERAEGERQGRESAIQELFEIERDKWSDAVHCTCMGYALIELSGGEESEGGKQMEKRLRALPTDSTEL